MLLAGGATAWPTINSGIIVVHILVLFYGLYLIKVKKDIRGHKRTMITAGVVFLVFLASFLIRISTQGPAPLGSWDFPVQPAHLQLLHAIVALVTVVAVAATYYLGLRGRYEQHRVIAPWAFGLWVFTGLFGITGHLIYPPA